MKLHLYFAFCATLLFMPMIFLVISIKGTLILYLTLNVILIGALYILFREIDKIVKLTDEQDIWDEDP